MSEQAGLTVDDNYVDNGDYGDDTDDSGDDGDTGAGSGAPATVNDNGNNPPPKTTEHTERSEYSITRPADGSSDHPLHIDYENGESVEFVWDNNGLQSINDTSTNTRMINTEDGWYMEDASGQRTKIDGTVSVDDATAAITIQYNDGSKTTIQPNGRVEKQDAEGNLIAVGVDQQPDPSSLKRNDSHDRASFSNAEYDADHNLTGVTDQYGNRFELKDGQWYMQSSTGDIPVNGDVKVDKYGMTIVPRANGEAHQ
jgi:YD repeat-containing protein